MASRPNKTAAKRYFRVAQALVKDLLVVFVAGQNDGYVNCWNRKRKRVERITRPTAMAIADVPYPWMVCCAVTGRRQDGEQYAKLEWLAAPHNITQSQIAKHCNELHQQLLAKFNPMHKLTAAWVASPRGEMLDEKEIDEIITALGAYEFLAKWESPAEQ
jgi:hypothetical protein